jgi:hypothetical protein
MAAGREKLRGGPSELLGDVAGLRGEPPELLGEVAEL